MAGFDQQIRASIDAAQPLLKFSSDPLTNPDGTITLGGVLGTIDLKLSDVKTAAITWLTGVYDLEIVDSIGDAGIGFTWDGSVATTNQPKPELNQQAAENQPSSSGTQTL